MALYLSLTIEKCDPKIIMSDVDEMYQLEETLLSSLHEATHQKLISWQIVQNDNRVVFSTQIKDAPLQIEFVYFPTSVGETHEELLTRVSGLGIYFSVADGTRSHDIIQSMLSMQIFGWAEGRLDSIKKLQSANSKVQKLLGS
jgi:hypothetical protein